MKYIGKFLSGEILLTRECKTNFHLPKSYINSVILALLFRPFGFLAPKVPRTLKLFDFLVF